MQTMIPMIPLVHTMNPSVSSSSGSGQAMPLLSGERFDVKLAALLAGAGSTQGQEDMPNNMTALLLEHTMMLQHAESMPEDEANDLTLLAMLMAMLEMDDEQLQQLLDDHPELHGVLQAAQSLLAGLHETQHHQQWQQGSSREHTMGQQVSEQEVQIKPEQFKSLRHTIVQLIGQLPNIGGTLNNSALSENSQAMADRVLAALQMTSVQHQTIQLSMNHGQLAAQTPGYSLPFQTVVQQMTARFIADDSRSQGRDTLTSLALTSTEDEGHVEQNRLLALMDRLLKVATTVRAVPQHNQMSPELNDAEKPGAMPFSTNLVHDIIKSVIPEQRPMTTPTFIAAQQFPDQVAPFLIKQVQLAQSQGISEARIALVPEHLGHVNIHIVMKSGQMVAQFVAETMHGKQVLEGQLSQLRTVLQEQGIQVNKLEVLQGQPSNLFQQPHEQHAAKQSFGSNKQGRGSFESYSDDFSLDVEDNGRSSSHIYGGSFEAVV